MKKAVLLAGGLAAGVVLLFIVFQFFPFHELITLLGNIPAILIIPYLIVSVGIYMLLTLRWNIILRVYDIRVNFWRLLSYRFVGHAVSFITPGPRVGGEAVRGALLKREGIPVSQGVGTVVADKTIELTSFGVMFIIGLVTALVTLDLPGHIRASLALASMILLVIVGYGFTQMLRGKDPVMRLFTLLRLHKIPALKKHQKSLKKFEENMSVFYREHKKAYWHSNIMSAIAWSMSILEYYVVLLMLGIKASFIKVFLVYSVVGIVYLIPIPLALGTFEALQATLFTGIGFRAVAGAALATITRGRDLLFTLVGFIFLGYYGFNGLKKT